MIVHEAARQLGVAILHRFEDLLVLSPCRIAVIVDVHGGIHDAFHLRARIHYSSQQHLVPRKPGDIYVEGRVGADKAGIAISIALSVRGLREFTELLQRIGVHSVARGAICCQRFHSRPEFVNVVYFLQRELVHEISAVRNDAQQSLVLQTHRGFSDRSPAAFVTHSKKFFAESLSRLINATNNVALQCAINFFTEGIGLRLYEVALE